MKKIINAALNGKKQYEGKAYFFKDQQYLRYDWKREEIDPGFPKNLSEWNLPGEFNNGFDTALNGAGNYDGKAYFFRKDEYISYDWATGKIDPEYPKHLSAWKLPLFFVSGIDAAINGSGKYANKAYFFKGDQYARYDWTTNSIDFVGNLIAWKLPITGVDAALEGNGAYNKKAYFFNQGNYVRYDWTNESCDIGYPAPLSVWKLPAGFADDSIPAEIDKQLEFTINEFRKTHLPFELGTFEGSGSFKYQTGKEESSKIQCCYKRFSNSIFIYRDDYKKVFEVHGMIYQEYKKFGFEADGQPKKKPGLGLPRSDEMIWKIDADTDIGRRSEFDRAVISWRRKDLKIIIQAIDNTYGLYWGIDSVQSYKSILSPGVVAAGGGDLLNKTRFMPCFKPVYLRKDEIATAREIDEIFTHSIGLTKTFLIDNSFAKDYNDLSPVFGKDLGIDRAIKSCEKASFVIKHYLTLSSSPANQINLVPLFGDIEPQTPFDKYFVEGWLQGFKTYNSNPANKIKFIPGLYVSLDKMRPLNISIIKDFKSSELLIWQQHPNNPPLKDNSQLTEKNIFDIGFKPSEETIGGLWQFNNYDARFFIRKDTYWIDHDLATRQFFDLFWAGDEKKYSA